MRRMFHHAVVLIAVFALVASAAAWRQCAGLQMAAAAAGHAQHQHMAQSPSGHDHAAMHHHKADDPASPATPAMDDHGCQKCCSMCMVANALLPAAGNAVALKWTSVTFAGATERRTGNLVAIDPGIPKRIV
jgi:ABC-type nickel/cobalt efflux system permease component RcnA